MPVSVFGPGRPRHTAGTNPPGERPGRAHQHTKGHASNTSLPTVLAFDDLLDARAVPKRGRKPENRNMASGVSQSSPRGFAFGRFAGNRPLAGKSSATALRQIDGSRSRRHRAAAGRTKCPTGVSGPEKWGPLIDGDFTRCYTSPARARTAASRGTTSVARGAAKHLRRRRYDRRTHTSLGQAGQDR